MTSQTTPSTAADDVTTTASASYTNPTIQSLWGVAESLISSYYPSAALSDIASLTWPGTVVIDSSTYIFHTGASSQSSISTATRSSSSTPQSSAAERSTSNVIPSATEQSSSSPTSTTNSAKTVSANTENGNNNGKYLGIGLGVGLGCAAIAAFVFLAWLVKRRKGSKAKYASNWSSSASESGIRPWHTQDSSSANFPEKYINLDAPLPPAMPMQTHTAYTGLGIHTDEPPRRYEQAPNDGDISYSPYASYVEPSSRQFNHVAEDPALIHELHGDTVHTPSNDSQSAVARSELAGAAAAPPRRPSTPYSPALMREPMSPVSPISPADDDPRWHGFWRGGPGQYTSLNEAQQHDHDHYRHSVGVSNPFTSEEDGDDDDDEEEPPVIPARSPRRRSSPMVHYPSGNELSTFDFGLVHDISGDRRVSSYGGGGVGQ